MVKDAIRPQERTSNVPALHEPCHTPTHERLCVHGRRHSVFRFFRKSVVYLGLEFSAEGYRPVETLIPRLDKLETPTDKKGVQKFLGIINFYRHHIPDMSTIASPLQELIEKKSRFKWSKECDFAFHQMHCFLQRK